MVVDIMFSPFEGALIIPAIRCRQVARLAIFMILSATRLMNNLIRGS
jgi:hypothetical protein